jgi:hypothetical protein
MSKSESLFMWLSPVPFLLTIVIPAACNIVFNFSPDVHAPNVLILGGGLGRARDRRIPLLGKLGLLGLPASVARARGVPRP